MLPYGGSSNLPGEGEVYCMLKSMTRSPPPQGGERASSAVSLVSPPPALSLSASYVVSHWPSAASGYPRKDTEDLHDTLYLWCIQVVRGKNGNLVLTLTDSRHS